MKVFKRSICVTDGERNALHFVGINCKKTFIDPFVISGYVSAILGKFKHLCPGFETKKIAVSSAKDNIILRFSRLIQHMSFKKTRNRVGPNILH